MSRLVAGAFALVCVIGSAVAVWLVVIDKDDADDGLAAAGRRRNVAGGPKTDRAAYGARGVQTELL